MHSDVESARAIGTIRESSSAWSRVRNVGRFDVLDYHVWGALAALVGMWFCPVRNESQNPFDGKNVREG